jgi:hypothetical protein
LDACGVFLGRDAFDFSRFDFRDAAVSFGFPRFSHGRLNAAVPRDHDSVNQFRHDFARHFAGFLDDLIQCYWHGASLAHTTKFDKGEAEKSESVERTKWTALLEPATWCCYASKQFMLSTPTNKFSRNVAGLMPHPERACEPLLGSDDGKWIFESIFAALKNKTVAQAA